jgi:hypothetical protein
MKDIPSHYPSPHLHTLPQLPMQEVLYSYYLATTTGDSVAHYIHNLLRIWQLGCMPYLKIVQWVNL